MSGSDHGTGPSVVHAVLVGGPDSLPTSVRSHHVPADGGKIKVLHLGSYEHFEHTGESQLRDDGEAVVYRWTMRTRIAE